MIKESLYLISGTFIVSVSADVSLTDVATSSSSYWYEDVFIIGNRSYQIWILSILASCVIGLSGILPLIIIPYETGAKVEQKGMYIDSVILLGNFL